jgi:hypothetical protein
MATNSPNVLKEDDYLSELEMPHKNQNQDLVK